MKKRISVLVTLVLCLYAWCLTGTNAAPLSMSPSYGFEHQASFIGPLMPPCPLVAEPVCGNNGVTYLNPCFALNAGISQYTPGVCYGSACINPAAINLALVCPQVNAPVCGCNGQTYANPCEAERFGITAYRTGPCQSVCYSPSLVVNGGGVNLNEQTGVLTMACTQNNAPVCGCNGVTYSSPCAAQASGITFYTYGSCATNCINPAAMSPEATCPTVFTPVCGCNGVTYPNACLAAASGVSAYTPGACASLSTWCSQATPIQCGDFLPFETTTGSVSSIGSYPNCSNFTYQGPDRVYMIHKTTPGDLQIGLEIVSQGLDLDLFLLSGNCSQLTCLRSSTTNNSMSPNEGIVLPNAPIGTYYIVVDSKNPAVHGQFRLEVSCGYLRCDAAIPLTCGVPFNHTNANGRDDVSSYGCQGNILNVENNGPEVVHSFTITQSGWVNISLTNLQDNLELFLLHSCDRGSCVRASETSGTAGEQLTEFLAAGTYYLVVDGYNGAVSPYTLVVNCTAGCNFAFANVNATVVACGQSNGVITYSTSGGSANYFVQYSGPVSGSFVSASATGSISNLPAGNYDLRVTDANGCLISRAVTVSSATNMDATISVVPALCGSGGSASFSISNGLAPHTIQLTGPVSGTYNAGTVNPFTISNLSNGAYTASIRNAAGCVISRTFTVTQSSGSFNFTATPVPAGCDTPGSVIVNTFNGTGPYLVSISGPQSRTLLNTSNQFTIGNLPGGTYTLSITSSGACTVTQTVVVPNAEFSFSSEVINGACDQPGRIELEFNGGVPPYAVSWTGPNPGSIVTSAPTYTINGLFSGSYIIEATDSQGCDKFEAESVNNSEEDLEVSFTSLGGTCSTSGAIAIQVSSGMPAYTVLWAGPVSGSRTFTTTSQTIQNLPAGTYQLELVDANGCSAQGSVTISTGGLIDYTATVINGGCGQNGVISLAISGSLTQYNILWTGPVNGSALSQGSNYNINGLPSGIYTVTVTGGNCQIAKTIAVANGNPATFHIELMPVYPTCTTEGGIWLDIYGGPAPYTVTWVGPETGTLVTSLTAMDMMVQPGTYTVIVTNAAGCSAAGNLTIPNNVFDATAAVFNGNCASPTGSVMVSISNGSPAFNISWTGPVNGFVSTSSNNYLITNLPQGVYTIHVSDFGGCSVTRTVQISGVFSVDVLTTEATCGPTGSAQLSMHGGVAPYSISWSGESNGAITVATNSYHIQGLMSGTYVVVVADANGCLQESEVTISSNENLDLVLVQQPGNCGTDGLINIFITGSSSSYQISWSGAESGSMQTSGNSFSLQNLRSGDYQINVLDASGCSRTESITLDNNETDFEVNITTFPGGCGLAGQMLIAMSGGQLPYAITWTGPVSGSINTSNPTFLLTGLPSGTYEINVTEADGCNVNQAVVLDNSSNAFQFTATPQPGLCAVSGSIFLQMSGGIAPYTVSWTGPETGSVNTNTISHTITNLINSGTYVITVVDANGCSFTRSVLLNNIINNIQLNAVALPGLCGNPGQVRLEITGGQAPFAITWSGPTSGTATTAGLSYTVSNLSTGVYTFTVTDAQGCSRIQSASINNETNNLQLSAVPVSGSCGQLGRITLAIGTGIVPFTVTWTGPQFGSVTTNSFFHNIQNLVSGVYTVAVVDALGCTRSQSITINNQPNNLQVVASPVPGVCGQAGLIQLGMSGGPAPYNISWSGPQTGSASSTLATYTILGLQSGTYAVTVADGQGCSRVQNVVLNNLPNNIQMSATALPGLCGQTGRVQLSYSGVVNPVTVSWSGTQSGTLTSSLASQTITNLASGNYTFTVTDALGCTRTQAVVLNNLPNTLQLTAAPLPGICGNTGQIQLGIAGGVSPFSVSWTGPLSGNASTGGLNYSISGLVSGIYSITVTDAQGCSRTQSAVTLNNIPNSLQFTATSIQGFCDQPGSIQIATTGGVAPFSVAWSGTQSGNLTAGTGTFSIPALGSGIYTVTVTDAQGCSRTRTSITLTNLPNTVQLQATAQPGTCGQPGRILTGISGGTAPFTVSWSGPSSGSISVSTGGYIIPNLNSGVYSVTVTDAQGCSRSQGFIALNNTPNNLQLTAAPVQGICGQPGRIQLTMTGGIAPITISWTGPQSGSMTTAAVMHSITNLVSGTYTVVVTDAQGCSRSQTVGLNNLPNTVQLTASALPGLCGAAGQIQVGLTGGSTPYTLSWTGPQTGSATVSANNYLVSGLSGGVYTLTATDAQGCSRSQTINLNNVPNNVQVNLQTVPGFCGQPGQILLGLSGGLSPYAIQWSGAQSGSTTALAGNVNIPNLGSGAYTIVVTDAQGCSRTLTATLDNNTNNLVVGASTVPGLCGQAGQISLAMSSGQAPYSVVWTGTQSGSATASTNSYAITGLGSGSYTVVVTDSRGCARTHNVQLINQQALGFTANAQNGLCGGLGSVQLAIAGFAPPYTINWSGPSSGSGVTSTGSFAINNLPSGTYTITLSNTANCTATQTVTLNNSAFFSMGVQTLPGICNLNGSMLLNFTGNAYPINITWSGPVSGNTQVSSSSFLLSNLPGGLYTLTATNAQNCSDTDVINLDNSANSFSVQAVSTNGVCGEPGAVTLLMSGGTEPYTIEWTGAESGSLITGGSSFIIPQLQEGGYNFVVTDANGCTATAGSSILVTENDMVITVNQEVINCGNNIKFEVEISGGNPGYVINWNGPESGSFVPSGNTYIIDNVDFGIYQIEVVDANGCTQTIEVTPDAPDANLSIDVISIDGICGGPSAIVVNIFSTDNPYRVSWTGPASSAIVTNNPSYSIINPPAGFYTIEVVDSDSCIATATAMVVNQPGVTISTTVTNGNCGGLGSITASVMSGTGPFTISWTGPVNGSTVVTSPFHTINNLPSGNYTVMVTDANGCVASTTVQVQNQGSAFSIDAQAFNGNCNQQARIVVNMFGGSGPYVINWIGPASGTVTTSAPIYELPNMPVGIYVITVEDAFGCTGMDMEMITVSPTTFLDVAVTPIHGTCGHLGSIWLTVLSGQGPFTVSWSGPQQGTTNTSSTDFDIPNLASGDYLVTVTDAGGCQQVYPITLNNAPDNLDITLTANNSTCGNLGSITVNIASSAAPYTVTWLGLYSHGTEITSANTFTIPNLQTGNYMVRVDNALNCHEIRFLQVYNEPGSFEMTLTPNVGGCYQQGSLEVSIAGGQAPFHVTWQGTASSGAATFPDQSYILYGLTPDVYNVMVVDALGCSEWQTVVLTQGASVPVAGFTRSLSMLTASFTNQSSPGNYFWDFGDGTSSTLTNPVHQYTHDGTYYVCLTVSNICGSTTYCEYVDISIPSSMVILDLGEVSGQAGTTVLVPVRMRHLGQLVSIAGSLQVMQSSVANIVGVQAAAINPDYQPTGHTFNYYASNNNSIAVTQNQILFYVQVYLTGNPGQSSNIRITGTPLAVQVRGLVNGQVVNVPHVALIGSVSVITPLLSEEAHMLMDSPTDDESLDMRSEATEKTADVVYQLYQNAPNPFNGTTTLSFDLPEPMPADIIITDHLGRTVRIIRGDYAQGRNTVIFEAGGLTPGTYRFTIKTSEFVATRTMILTR